MSAQIMITRTLLCLTLLFLVCKHQANSQYRARIDSLKQVLRQHPHDTIRANIYSDIGKYYAAHLSSIDTARTYADSSWQLSEKLGYHTGKIRATLSYAYIHKEESDYQEAMDQFQQYADYWQRLGDSVEMADGLYGIGLIYNYLGEYEKNIKIQFRILRIYQTAGRKVDVANSMYSIGNVHRNMGNFSEASDMYRSAIEIYQELRMSKRHAMGIFAIGNVHFSEGKYQDALGYYQQALDLILNLDLPYETAFILGNIGATYEELDQDRLALDYHTRSLIIRRSLPQKLNLAHCLDNVGYMYYKMGNYSQAEEYYQEALNIVEQLGAKSEMAEVYQDISDLHFAQKDFENAYHYYVLYAQTEDSIFNSQKTRQISELQTKYETAQKDREIALLNKEKEVQQARTARELVLRNALIASLVLLGIIAFLVYYTMRQRLRNQKLIASKNKAIELSQLKEKLKSLELKALRVQMNPHFLFNCLNSINTMILQQDTASASKYLTKFSKLVRLTLENSEDVKVKLKDEIELLHSYIQLESIRLKDKIFYQILVSDTIDPETTYLPSMVLQPFIENAIWHGLCHNPGTGELKVEIEDREYHLLCTITDNGIGREQSVRLQKEITYKKRSMGIKITSDRLELLSRYSDKEVVKIMDLKDQNNNPAGTKVNVLIPIS